MTRGVFGNALKFSHFEALGNVDRTPQFRFLRDNLDGYGLVMLHYPDVPMPEAAIKRDELIEMIQEYDNADDERAKKRAKTSKL